MKTTFEKIRAAVAAHEAEQNRKDAEWIKTQTAGQIVNNWALKAYTTPKTLEALEAMNPDEKPSEDIIAKMIKKAERKNAKNTAERIAKIEAAENAEDVNSITINVEYYRSRTWGWNPTATVIGRYDYTHGSASGCGYDKTSAAMSYAMNDSPEVMRILYKHAEAGETFPYSVHTFAGVPSFDGGCGVTCFYAVFEACGYKFRQTADGRTFSAFSIEKA